ncbi:hypothetical protein [Streptomyces sp. NPDC051561]|uniref:hypothetical protein n=1 Tax=Streptomyces sp. NPDC051561 TaxID=3365658 RepID=UPI0037A716F3
MGPTYKVKIVPSLMKYLDGTAVGKGEERSEIKAELEAFHRNLGSVSHSTLGWLLDTLKPLTRHGVYCSETQRTRAKDFMADYQGLFQEAQAAEAKQEKKAKKRKPAADPFAASLFPEDKAPPELKAKAEKVAEEKSPAKPVQVPEEVEDEEEFNELKLHPVHGMLWRHEVFREGTDVLVGYLLKDSEGMSREWEDASPGSLTD